MAAKIEVQNLDDLINRYLSGTSLLQLEKEVGISRITLDRRFRKLQVRMRTQSETELVKWERIKTDRTLVERQCGAAWASTRGSIVSMASKIARAKTTSQRLLHVGAHERALMDVLIANGLSAKHQANCGPYNLDVSIHSLRIAVEIQTAYLNGGKSMRPKRFEYILNHGWWLLVIYCPKRHGPYTGEVLAKHVLTFAEAVSRLPTFPRQYGMIRGDGQRVTLPSAQPDHLSRVPGF